VVAAVAPARHAGPGGRQRAEVALEVSEVLMAAVAGVDVQDNQNGRDAGANVVLGPAAPPAGHPGRVAGGGVQAVTELVGTVAGLVGLVAG
jgi:hypothetical protein